MAVSAEDDTTEASRRKIPAVSMLPNGSVLESVMLPRYDQDRKLVDVLRAKVIELVDSERISGQEVSIEFYNPDRSRRGRIDLREALFDQENGLLTASEEVQIDAEGLVATGSGLVYDFRNGEGFLLGPVATRITTPAETAMNLRPSPLAAAALLGVSLFSLPVVAAPPPPLTPAELAALERDAASKSELASEAVAAVNRSFEAIVAADEKAKSDALRFLKKSGLVLIANEAAAPGAEIPAGEPLAVEPNPNNTLIKCENGMYFDAEEGVLVYLKNVTVTDPRFNLSGANELKVYFEKKAADAGADEPEEEPGDGVDLGRVGAGFGEVSRIVATGAVRILQKGVDGGEPIEASGAILSYDVKAGQIIISGGFPWVRPGPNKHFKAMRPNERLRILTTGSFVTEGFWEMGLPLNEKR